MCQSWSGVSISKALGAETVPKNRWNKEKEEEDLMRHHLITITIIKKGCYMPGCSMCEMSSLPAEILRYLSVADAWLMGNHIVLTRA